MQTKPKLTIDPKKNTIVCGDNLEWLKYVPDESVDLCYIDPPFFSNATYEKVWGNGWEVTSFGDRFAGGINHYIEWMKPRIQSIHKKLKTTGSIFLHCDWHAAHRLRCLLDDIFGEKNFVNEIIWAYTGPANVKRNFPRKHDNIFWYSKSENYFIDLDYSRKEYSDAFINRRKYTEGKSGIFSGKGKKEDSEIESYKKGKVREDWWSDIPSGGQISSKELIGYKTQKPELLVSRIIGSASKENDVILDCFAGGFTTAKVCSDLNRKFICGDVSPVACKIGAKRLNQSGFHDYELKGMPQTEEEFRSMEGHKFAEVICELMGWKCNPIKSNDKGIDGWDGNGNPVQIKNHKTKTGEKDLRNFLGALTAAKKNYGIFVAWDFVEGKGGAYEFVQKHKKEVQIEIRKCRELIGDLLIPKGKKDEIDVLPSLKPKEDVKNALTERKNNRGTEFS